MNTVQLMDTYYGKCFEATVVETLILVTAIEPLTPL